MPLRALLGGLGMFSRYRYYRVDKEKVLEKLKQVLVKEDKVLLAIVFGSFTRLRSYRDIDIAVYSLDDSIDYLAKLATRLELELGIPVDIIPLSEIDPKFKWKILTKGTIVVEKSLGLYEALLNQTIDELRQLEIAKTNTTRKDENTLFKHSS